MNEIGRNFLNSHKERQKDRFFLWDVEEIMFLINVLKHVCIITILICNKILVSWILNSKVDNYSLIFYNFKNVKRDIIICLIGKDERL